MKPLPPSLREKKRYLLIGGGDASAKTILRELEHFLGVFGLAEASPSLIRSTSKGIIFSINRSSLTAVRAAMAASSKELGVTRVSGTLKGLGQK